MIKDVTAKSSSGGRSESQQLGITTKGVISQNWHRPTSFGVAVERSIDARFDTLRSVLRIVYNGIYPTSTTVSRPPCSPT
ncbi:hypothetical protein BC938DRAFT_472747 [Jimgerdemannia flammicorona]|uniref:Uncharacterized protein n=1 Tax=Jimgerdemannia flammicorona TaxID=994334 RepID=A0A433Q5G1_9FUNG|nr:hypothetical protein BC938DRAFT_472747 [Jimgerdemannia flammicorona]